MLFFFSSNNVDLANENNVCYFECEKYPESVLLWQVKSFVGTNFDTTDSGIPTLGKLTDTLYSNLNLVDFLTLSKKVVATTPDIFLNIIEYIESGSATVFVSQDVSYITSLDQLTIIQSEDELEVTKFLMMDGLSKVFASSIPWKALLSFNMFLTRIHAWALEGKITITSKALADTNLVAPEVIQNLSLESSINEDIKELLLQYPTLQIVDVNFDAFTSEELAFLSEYMRMYQSLVLHYGLFLDSLAVLRGCTTVEALFTATNSALCLIKDSVNLMG